MTGPLRGGAILWLALALPGCGVDADRPVIEQVHAAPLRLEMEVEGELKSGQATPLKVPGAQWSQRQLEWVVADGSHVGKGELVARFIAPSGELDLEQARIDLQRNALARQAKQAELVAGQGRVAVDLTQVRTELGIAERYASADLTTLSRNELLDAVQDTEFLGVKQGVLEWKQGQAEQRGGAELAVLDAQRATYQLNAKTKQDDLDALELRAPHDGVFMLTANWTGEKPAIGSAMWAGNEFGSLPDIASLEVELSLPQLLAQGLEAGQEVLVHPLGRPDQEVTTRLSWVASSAKTVGRNNPVKYVSMKAPLDAEAVRRFGWVPGQRMAARVVLLDADEAISVPNIALASEDGVSRVAVLDGGDVVERTVELGVRGPARSQVVKGLRPGDRVVLAGAGLGTTSTTTTAMDANANANANAGADDMAGEDA
ncbi:efflux RND transporter periplasmic adaptor subunit [Marilutibacter alkalisoli]|uniref:efflux RND transporter periplasmic adaptor subunit n=1 Tax=Marilutibacter alkalisoli TaxID=2591633 RepID=UPI001ABE1770|nr:hypothetical protein [Lysobacter alkalisoli]